LYANLQLAASLPNCGWFEYPYEEPGWSHATSSFLFNEGPCIKDGYIEIPQKPGLGFELDMDKIRKYTVK
jgi:L-alanine-DL-glutamate epimerase-like enolase superfamily enzyme